MSLALSGYQVGKSNHTVYLLDGLRRSGAGLLANDWFTNNTLQYHGLFSQITRLVLDAGLFQPVFLIGYLATVLWFHISARKVVKALGGSNGAYLLAVLLLHLSAGGTGLGGFQFLQDGAFLPSNISNVAMLAGIAGLMEARIWWAAVCLGLAGLFHINHAIFAPWVFLVGVLAQGNIRSRWSAYLAPALLVAVLISVNIVPALTHLGSRDPNIERMPLTEFVQIYARLRHPHHYYPLAWHPLVILASIWTLLPAGYVLAMRGHQLPVTARRVLCAVCLFLLFATSVAWTFAGISFVSERLIQMAVFRFSILYIYLSCALVAWGVVDSGLLSVRTGKLLVGMIPVALIAILGFAMSGIAGTFIAEFVRSRFLPLGLTAAFGIMLWGVAFVARNRPAGNWIGGSIGLILLLVVTWPRLGLNYIPEDPLEYVRLANWARDHTDKDALFLVPPQEQSWRVEAQRAVVINFKAIPQTSAEMPEWKRRMIDVTGVENLPSLAGTFNSALTAIGQAYDRRSVEELRKVAQKYHCRYIVTSHDIPEWNRIGPADGTGPFRLYDLGDQVP